MWATARVILRVTKVSPRRGRLVVEQDAAAGVHPVAFAVVDRDVVREQLGAGVGAAGVEAACASLCGGRRPAEHLARGGLVEARLDAGSADGLQQAEGAGGSDVGGVFGNLEADPHVALRGEVVDLVRTDVVQQLQRLLASVRSA